MLKPINRGLDPPFSCSWRNRKPKGLVPPGKGCGRSRYGGLFCSCFGHKDLIPCVWMPRVVHS
jgi:hypothetical protein